MIGSILASVILAMNVSGVPLPSWENALALTERVFRLSESLGDSPVPRLRERLEDAALSGISALYRAQHRSAAHARALEVDSAERHFLDVAALWSLAAKHPCFIENSQAAAELESTLRSLLAEVKAFLSAAHFDAAKGDQHQEQPRSGDAGEAARRHREMMEELRRLGRPNK
jgi:hypothetical protein